MATLEAIKYSRGKLLVLDQLRLPHENHYDAVSTSEEAFDCIRSMRVRGAPAIAIVAALAHAVELHNGSCGECLVLTCPGRQVTDGVSGNFTRGYHRLY